MFNLQILSEKNIEIIFLWILPTLLCLNFDTCKNTTFDIILMAPGTNGLN